MTAEEASNLRIRVAPPESYRAANVDYNPNCCRARRPSCCAAPTAGQYRQPHQRSRRPGAVRRRDPRDLLGHRPAGARIHTCCSIHRLRARAGTGDRTGDGADDFLLIADHPRRSRRCIRRTSAAARLSRGERRAAARVAGSGERRRAPARAASRARASAAGAERRHGQGRRFTVTIAARTLRPGVSLDQMLVLAVPRQPAGLHGQQHEPAQGRRRPGCPIADTAKAVPPRHARSSRRRAPISAPTANAWRRVCPQPEPKARRARPAARSRPRSTTASRPPVRRPTS